jgi:hypothetical protein
MCRIYDNIKTLDDFENHNFNDLTTNKFYMILCAWSFQKNNIFQIINEINLLKKIFDYVKQSVINDIKYDYLKNDNIFCRKYDGYDYVNAWRVWDLNIFFPIICNEYIPNPWYSFIDPILLKCHECDNDTNSHKCYKITNYYRRKDILSYKIDNICNKCIETKQLYKLNEYNYYINANVYGEICLIVSIPFKK